MKTVVITKKVDETELAELRQPRTAPLTEQVGVPSDPDTLNFELDDGPFDHYRRILVVDEGPDADGQYAITETTEFQLAIPVWGVLFVPLVKRAIRKPPPPGKQVWWMPPDHMDRRATQVLSLLCVFSAIAGYLGVLISQTNPYFQKEFDVSTSVVSDAVIAVRIGAFLALFVVAFADRRGRRRVLMVSTYLAIILAATGAFAPSLMWLGISQGFARAFSAAIALLITIIAVEEMPAGARAFAVSVMAMSAAVGAGGVVLFLGLADLAPWAWRIFFIVPLLFLFGMRPLGRRMPETRRFEVYELHEEREREAQARDDVSLEEALDEAIGPNPMAEALAGDARSERFRRFAMIGSTALFFNVFLAPAGFFLNNFLLNEQHFSGGQISIFQVLTNVPGGAAIIVGGRLADERGRRLIGSIGVIGGVGFTVLMFNSSGVWLWVFSALATLTGAMVIPALGVYQSELFSTGTRGKANGGLNLLGVAGAVFGLKVCGQLVDRFGSFGPAMAILSIGPAIVAAIVILFYPETTHKTLEELNPQDAPPPQDASGLAALDHEWDQNHEHPDHPPSEPEGADHGEDRPAVSQATPAHDVADPPGTMTPRV